MRSYEELTDEELIELYESGMDGDWMDELVKRFQQYSIQLKTIENDTQRFGE